jgi:mRNA interferase YafQ
MVELRDVMQSLITREMLAERHQDHELSGDWRGHRDCHVRADWLQIYRIQGEVVTFERTGTHSDLFG